MGSASTESHITAVTLLVCLTGFLKTEFNSPWPVLPFLSSTGIDVAASDSPPAAGVDCRQAHTHGGVLFIPAPEGEQPCSGDCTEAK